jgi:hypothetical protein
VRRAEDRDRAARLREGGRMRAVRVDDPADVGKRDEEVAMCRRVGRGVELSLDACALEVDEDHVGRAEIRVGDAAGLDREDRLCAIDRRSVSKSQVDQAVAGQGDVCLVGFAFQFGEHAGRSSG